MQTTFLTRRGLMDKEIRVSSTTGLMTRVLGEILRHRLDIPWGPHGLIGTFKPEHWTFKQQAKWGKEKYLPYVPQYYHTLYLGNGGANPWNRANGQLKMRVALTEIKASYLPAPYHIHWDIQVWVLMPDGRTFWGRFLYWLGIEDLESSQDKIVDPCTRPDFWKNWDLDLDKGSYTPEEQQRLHELGYWNF